VPGVLGVRETLDGVLIECDAIAGDNNSIREAVQMFYSLVSDGGKYPMPGAADD
jgi:hypothetical protein